MTRMCGQQLRIIQAPSTVHVCMNFYRRSSIKAVFFQSSDNERFALPQRHPGRSERKTQQLPALSLWPLRNKIFSCNWASLFLQAGLLVNRVCLRCFVKELFFHPHSKNQSTRLGYKETHWKGKPAGYSKHVGTELSRHDSFTMSILTKTSSLFGRNRI